MRSGENEGPRALVQRLPAAEKRLIKAAAAAVARDGPFTRRNDPACSRCSEINVAIYESSLTSYVDRLRAGPRGYLRKRSPLRRSVGFWKLSRALYDRRSTARSHSIDRTDGPTDTAVAIERA